MFFLKGVCDQSVVLKVIYFVGEILNRVLFLIPIFLIVLMIIDFSKSVIGKEEDMSKNLNLAIKRTVSAVFIFLLPNVVGLFVTIVGDKTSLTTCMANANLSYINQMQAEEEAAQSILDGLEPVISGVGNPSNRSNVSSSKLSTKISGLGNIPVKNSLPDGKSIILWMVK